MTGYIAPTRYRSDRAEAIPEGLADRGGRLGPVVVGGGEGDRVGPAVGDDVAGDRVDGHLLGVDVGVLPVGGGPAVGHRSQRDLGVLLEARGLLLGLLE